jgi:hypothetical protein
MYNYYTFEGPIISLDDSSGVLSSAGLSTGEKIRYTFLVNRSMEGTRTKEGGTQYVYDNDRNRVYFYTDLTNGSEIYKQNQIKSCNEEAMIIYNRGFESDRRFDLLSGSNKHYVNIWGNSIHIGPDSISLHGLECLYDCNRSRSVICSKLSLMSISDHCNLNRYNQEAVNARVCVIQDYFRL